MANGKVDTDRAIIELLLSGGIGQLGGLQGQPQPGSTARQQQQLQGFGPSPTGAVGMGGQGQPQFFPLPLTGQVPGQQSFAPTTQFTGGSPFPVDDTAQIFQNLLLILSSPAGKKAVTALLGSEALKGAVSSTGQGLADFGTAIGDIGGDIFQSLGNLLGP